MGVKNTVKKKVKPSKDKSKNKIHKKMSFMEILEQDPDAAEIFMARGMHCAGCPMASFESLEDGAMAHGIDAEEITKELNKNKVKKKKRDENLGR